MNKKNTFKIIILFSIIFFNCSKKQTNNRLERFNDFSNDVKSEVFKNLSIDENKITNSVSLTVINPYSLDTFKYCGMFLVCKFEDKEFKKEIELLNEKKIFKSSVLDSCNTNVSKKFITKNDNCKKTKPVPSINDEFNNLSKFVNSESDYVVLNNRKGNFIDDKFINELSKDNSNKNMDNYFTSEFSNGVILNYKSNYIIYWVIIM